MTDAPNVPAESPSRPFGGLDVLSRPVGLIAFVAVALVVYWPALRGEFLSDDFYYLWNSPAAGSLSWASVLDILDPFGSAAISIVNYAPVHLLLHGIEVPIFGRDPLGYHVVDVAVHALVSWLLLRLLLRSGVGTAWGVFGAALFLVHPANVEAVAWISQLKTTASLALTLAALLALRTHPALATLAFALALLTKAMAIVALPVALVFALADARGGCSTPDRLAGRLERGRWLLLWGALALGHSALELSIFRAASDSIAPLHEDPLLNAANIVVVGGRYLAMALTGTGLSTFHQPDPIERVADWRVLASALAISAIASRVLLVAVRRRTELGWWVFAAVSFAPVSQIFPFLHPIGDRYLYFILPGLIGGTLLALRDVRRRLPGRPPAFVLPLGLALVLVAFACRSFDRAAIWQNTTKVLVDSALHYPNGLKAHVLRARAAARRGDVAATVDSLEAARSRGYQNLYSLVTDPAMRRLRGQARFDAFVESIARERADHYAGLRPSQHSLANLAFAREILGDRSGAIEALDRALAIGGPMDARLAVNRAALADRAPH